MQNGRDEESEHRIYMKKALDKFSNFYILLLSGHASISYSKKSTQNQIHFIFLFNVFTIYIYIFTKHTNYYKF